MEIDLSPESIHKLAKTLAPQIARLIKHGEFEEWVTTNEAARILGVSPDWMRRTKDRYPYKKGEGKNAHILFKKSSLIKTYTQ